MNHEVYVMYDKKATHYKLPVYESNVTTVKRAILFAVQTDGGMLAKFPADFELFHLGSYDDLEGKINALPKPEFICSVATILSENQKHNENVTAAINGREVIF